jgi:hypothetical protein
MNAVNLDNTTTKETAVSTITDTTPTTTPAWLNPSVIPDGVRATTEAHQAAVAAIITEHWPTIAAAREHVLSLAQHHQGTPDEVWPVIAAETGETALWDLLDVFARAVMVDTTADDHAAAIERMESLLK